MGYIYILTSPCGKGYIGQTTRLVYKRLEEHRTGKSRCVAIYNAINFYGWENFKVDWYECPDGELNKHEKWMVNLMRTLSPEGYNLKEGGGNGKLSEETKQKIGDRTRGVSKSEEHRQRMSESRLGIMQSEETRQKIRKARLGIMQSEETREKIGEAQLGEKNHAAKRVYQYALGGTYVNTFGSCGEAERYIKNKDGTKISACARGKNITAYGFKWSYTYLHEA